MTSPSDRPSHPSASEIVLQVNGEPYTCPEGDRIPDLFVRLGLNPRLLALEYNGEILHRQYWDRTVLQTGDRIEIVTIVGGG